MKGTSFSGLNEAAPLPRMRQHIILSKHESIFSEMKNPGEKKKSGGGRGGITGV